MPYRERIEVKPADSARADETRERVKVDDKEVEGEAGGRDSEN